MKRILITILFTIFTAAPAFTQWNYIDLGVPVTAFGVQDSFLFIASGSNSHLYRYTVSRGYIYADTGIGFGNGNVIGFSSLGRYFYANEQAEYSDTYQSSNDGSRWQETTGFCVASVGRDLIGITDHPFSLQAPYIAISRDSGLSWDSVSNFNVTSWVVTFVPNGTCIFANTNGTIWRSTDTGNHWSQLSPTFVGTMTVMDSLLFIVSSGNVIESSDSGSHWNAVPVDSGGTVPEYVRVLATDGKNLFVGTPKGVFISMDHGSSWKPVDNTGLAGPNVIAMGVYDTLLAINVSYGLQTLYAVYTRPISEMTDTTSADVVQQTPQGDSIEVYPNPATGIVTILAGGTSILGISVLNILGTDVFDVSNQYAAETEIDLSSFASGTYFVRIQTATGSVLKKITLERS